MTRGELLARLRAAGIDARPHDVDHADGLFVRAPERVGHVRLYADEHLRVVRGIAERRQARRAAARARTSA